MTFQQGNDKLVSRTANDASENKNEVEQQMTFPKITVNDNCKYHFKDSNDKFQLQMTLSKSNDNS